MNKVQTLSDLRDLIAMEELISIVGDTKKKPLKTTIFAICKNPITPMRKILQNGFENLGLVFEDKRRNLTISSGPVRYTLMNKYRGLTLDDGVEAIAEALNQRFLIQHAKRKTET